MPNVTDPSFNLSAKASLDDNNRSSGILFFGRFDTYHKGLDLLVIFYERFVEFAHLHRLNPPHLNFVGARSDQEITNVESLFDNQILNQGLVRFHKSVDHEDRLNILLTHKFIVLASRYEGVPMAFLEAVSLGLIPLVSVGSNLARLISQYDCGFVLTESNVDLVASQILTIDECNISTMRKQAAKMIHQNFSKEFTSSLFLDLASKSLGI